MGIELRASGEAGKEFVRCSAEGCDARAIYTTRRLCKRHYWIVYKAGLVTAWPPPKRPSPERSFWSRTIAEPNSGCLLWMGHVGQDGYGAFGKDQKRAHRPAWGFVNGPIPAGLLVCHHCDNKICVEPRHLFLGTNKDNMVDMCRKGRKPKGERSPLAVLTDAQAIDIRRLYADGERHQDIAARFGVSQGAVQWITSGRHFAHLGGPIHRPRRY